MLCKGKPKTTIKLPAPKSSRDESDSADKAAVRVGDADAEVNEEVEVDWDVEVDADVELEVT